MVLQLTAGPAVAGRTLYNLALQTGRSPGALAAIP